MELMLYSLYKSAIKEQITEPKLLKNIYDFMVKNDTIEFYPNFAQQKSLTEDMISHLLSVDDNYLKIELYFNPILTLDQKKLILSKKDVNLYLDLWSEKRFKTSDAKLLIKTTKHIKILQELLLDHRFNQKRKSEAVKRILELTKISQKNPEKTTDNLVSLVNMVSNNIPLSGYNYILEYPNFYDFIIPAINRSYPEDFSFSQALKTFKELTSSRYFTLELQDKFIQNLQAIYDQILPKKDESLLLAQSIQDMKFGRFIHEDSKDKLINLFTKVIEDNQTYKDILKSLKKYKTALSFRRALDKCIEEANLNYRVHDLIVLEKLKDPSWSYKERYGLIQILAKDYYGEDFTKYGFKDDTYIFVNILINPHHMDELLKTYSQKKVYDIFFKILEVDTDFYLYRSLSRDISLEILLEQPIEKLQQLSLYDEKYQEIISYIYKNVNSDFSFDVLHNLISTYTGSIKELVLVANNI